MTRHWLAAVLVQVAFVPLSPGAFAAEEVPTLVIETGHSQDVTCLAFSPNSRFLASGSYDHDVIVWGLAKEADGSIDESQLHTLKGHQGVINSVSYNFNGSLLASASDDGRFCVWDSHSWSPHFQTNGPGRVCALAFSPTENVLLTGSSDNTLRLWRINANGNAELLHESAPTPNIELSAIAFTPDGTRFATGDGDHAVKLWALSSFSVQANLAPELPTIVRGLAFNRIGTQLAACSGGMMGRGAIAIWNLYDLRTSPITAATSDEWIASLAFDPAGHHLVAGVSNRVRRHAALRSLLLPQQGRIPQDEGNLPTESDSALAIAYSPDGSMFAAADLIHGISIRGSDEMPPIASHTTPSPSTELRGRVRALRSIAFSSDGKMLLSCEDSNAAGLWNLNSAFGMTSLRAQSARLTDIKFTATGDAVFSSTEDGLIIKQDLYSGLRLKSYQSPAGAIISQFAVSSRGNLLAAAGNFNAVRLLTIADGAWHELPGPHQDRVSAVSFSPDGDKLASASDDGTIHVWLTDAPTSAPQILGRLGDPPVRCIAILPNGTIVSGNDHGDLTFWRRSSGAFERGSQLADQHPSAITAVAASSDGAEVYFGRSDGRIASCNASTEAINWTDAGHGDAVVAIAVSKLGFVASAGRDAQIIVWDARQKSKVVSLVRLGANDWAAISPSGLFDASSGLLSDLTEPVVHWVQGNAPLFLSDLRSQFLVRGIVPAAFGFIPSSSQTVSIAEYRRPFAKPPKVVATLTPDQKLRLTVTDSGGGIGPVTVSLGGQQYWKDVLPRNYRSGRTITVDLSHSAMAAPVADDVVITARPSSPGYSRDTTAKYASPPSSISANQFLFALRDLQDTNALSQTSPTKIYLIAVGISNYGAAQLKLDWADQDAKDFAAALRLTTKAWARPLRHGNVALEEHLFTSDASDPQHLPTRANILAALEATKKALNTDIVILYLSGHGALYAKAPETSHYHFPCVAAQSLDSSQLATHQDWVISGDELISYLRFPDAITHVGTPAQTKLAIIDTCEASGLAASGSSSPALGLDDIRAADELWTGTGSILLYGCATTDTSYLNRASYASSHYEHSLLTYAVLRGLRGACLDSDGSIQVPSLLKYTGSKVPYLAGPLQLFQQPYFNTAGPSKSYLIGYADWPDRQQISAKVTRPLLATPIWDDSSGDPQLRSDLVTYLGMHSNPAVGYDLDDPPSAIDIPDAYRPSGSLKRQADGSVLATYRYKRNGQDVGPIHTIVAPADTAAAKIADGIAGDLTTFQ